MNNYTGHLETRIDIASRGHGLVSRLERWLQHLRTTLHRNHQHRTAIRELRALSDRQLEDIGIVRAQIPEIVQRLNAGIAVDRRGTDEEVGAASFTAGCCMGHS